MSIRLIRRPEVLRRTSLNTSTLYEQMDQGTFPRPTRIGPRAVAWVEDEVDDWISRRVAERGAPMPNHNEPIND